MKQFSTALFAAVALVSTAALDQTGTTQPQAGTSAISAVFALKGDALRGSAGIHSRPA